MRPRGRRGLKRSEFISTQRIITPYLGGEMSAAPLLVYGVRVDDPRCCLPVKQPMAKSPHAA